MCSSGSGRDSAPVLGGCGPLCPVLGIPLPSDRSWQVALEVAPTQTTMAGLTQRCLHVARWGAPCALASSQGPCWASQTSAPVRGPWGSPWSCQAHRAAAGRTSLIFSLPALSTETSSPTTSCWMSKVRGGREAPALRLRPWSCDSRAVLSSHRTRAPDGLQRCHHHKGRGEGDRAGRDQAVHG